MKRIKLITSILTLSFALVVCLGGVIGFFAALNANYQISGTVSYSAGHVNALVQHKLFKSIATEETTYESIIDSLYQTEPESGTKSYRFNTTGNLTESSPVASEDFIFDADTVAYKLEISVTNYGDFDINAYANVVCLTNNNWFFRTLHISAQTIKPSETGVVKIFVGIEDLAQNVNSQDINITVEIAKVSYITLTYQVGQHTLTQRVQKNATTMGLLSPTDFDYQGNILAGSYGTTNPLQRTAANGEKQGVGEWKEQGTSKIVDATTIITQNLTLEPADWWFYDCSDGVWRIEDSFGPGQNNSLRFDYGVTTIPAKIILPKQVNGYTVTDLGQSSFIHENIQRVKIPNTVLTIEGIAFGPSLQKIEIPASVNSFYDVDFSTIFYNCLYIAQIVVDDNNPVYKSPTNREIIKDNSIIGYAKKSGTTYLLDDYISGLNMYSLVNSTLKNITISSKFLFTLEEDSILMFLATAGVAISVSGSVESITVHPEHPFLSSPTNRELIVDIKDFEVGDDTMDVVALIAYANASGTDYTVPDGVQFILPYAMACSEVLQSVVFPESMVYMDVTTFAFNSDVLSIRTQNLNNAVIPADIFAIFAGSSSAMLHFFMRFALYERMSQLLDISFGDMQQLYFQKINIYVPNQSIMDEYEEINSDDFSDNAVLMELILSFLQNLKVYIWQN